MSEVNELIQGLNDQIDSLGDREAITKLENAEQIVDSANQEIKALSMLERMAEIYSRAQTPFLIAVSYGALSFLVTILLITFINQLSAITITYQMAILISTLTSIIGAATGVIKWRGDDYQKAERRSLLKGFDLQDIDEQLEKSRNHYERLERQHQSLPDNAPKELHDQFLQSKIQELITQRKLREFSVNTLFEETRTHRVSIEENDQIVSSQNPPQLPDNEDQPRPSHSPPTNEPEPNNSSDSPDPPSQH